MEAIRTIQTTTDGKINLQLPKQFWGQEVEIIVLPSANQATQTSTPKKSLRGSLKQYANPELMKQEQGAWQSSVEEKHEPR